MSPHRPRPGRLIPQATLLLLAACSDYELGQQASEESLQGTLLVEPALVDFGLLEPGTSASEVLTLTALGDVGVSLEGMEQTGSGAFEVIWDLGGVDLSPGESRELVVSYTPVNTADEGLLRFTSDSGEGSVQLFGGGLWPAVTVDPGTIELRSTAGEPVSGAAWVESTGTATLELGAWMLEDTSVFEASLDSPLSLAPGEGTWLDVTFSPPDYGTWTSTVTIGTNTPTGQALVPILGEYPPPCLGLAEAWDRGMLDIEMDGQMDIVLTNRSDDFELCVDQWYVYLSSGTQDAGAGDPYFDPGAEYPMGTIRFGPGESVEFLYGLVDDWAWWCIEEQQVTQRTEVYEFSGARVPPVLLEEMLDGDQEGVWAWIYDNPAVLVGRNTHWLNLESTAPAGAVELEVRNLGRQDGVAWIEEHVPAGYAASGFTLEPTSSEADGGGGTVYTWELDLAAAIDTGTYQHTIYDVRTWTYTLTVTDGELIGRQTLPEPTALWEDSSGGVQTASGAPLVVEIQ